MHFTHTPVRRQTVPDESHSKLKALGGKWKASKKWTPGGRAAKMKMLKLQKARNMKVRARKAALPLAPSMKKLLADKFSAKVKTSSLGPPGPPGPPGLPAPAPPLPEVVGPPRFTTSGCACKTTWQLSGAEPCTESCCNPDSDPAGAWCAVESDVCQGANWGTCASASASTTSTTSTPSTTSTTSTTSTGSPYKITSTIAQAQTLWVDTDGDASDADGDVCRQYTIFPEWCRQSMFDDDDFTSSEMCCACGGGASGEATGGVGTGQVESSPPDAPSACADTDGTASDRDGDFCWAYADHPQWCGGFDDSDFTSTSMCCECGGGTSSPSQEEAPSQEEVTPAPSTCADLDQESTGDINNDKCDMYTPNPHWCMYGDDFDDDDFTAADLCCICGGGASS